MRTALLLADGFEEIEALTPVDVLRRAGIEIDTIGITGKEVFGAHSIKVEADIYYKDADVSKYDMLVLPGGMPGASNLDKSEFTDKIISAVTQNHGHIAAICASPMILGHRGLLRGKRAVCYPGFEGELEGAVIMDSPVVTCDNITTARGMGVSLEFSKELVRLKLGDDAAKKISRAIME